MEIALFARWTELLSGLCVGIVFGFLLRKAYVTRFHVVVGQLLLKDFTVMKVMLTAIGFGSIGFAILQHFQPDLHLDITPTTLLASIIGGGLFGVGMAILGFCPGTAIGALADGSKDVIFGLLGMVAGAAVYAECASWIQTYLKPSAELTTATIPDYLGVSPWAIAAIPIICIAGALLKKRTRFCDERR